MAQNNIILNEKDLLRIKKCILEARGEKTLNEHEIDRLINEIARAKIVEPHEISNNVVTVNSVIKISFPDIKKQIQLKIVYPNEADIKDWKISIFSPIANALFGYQIGDEIEWFIPSGITKIKIDDIIYEP